MSKQRNNASHRETYMEYTFNEIENDRYFGVITILYEDIDYENVISNLRFPRDVDKSKKFLVDKILLMGMNKERFEEYDLDEDGSVLYPIGRRANPDAKTIKEADNILKGYPEYLRNSVLTCNHLDYFFGKDSDKNGEDLTDLLK